MGLGWGWFEAGWVRFRELDVGVPGLPPELDGLRIAHLSDFHLGVPSRGAHAVERAVDWTAQRKPDLVAITGDLLTHPRGEARLRALAQRLSLPA
ncbi:MAG TPA: metallophosphoesterase, partial [Gaiellaceae bacterium]|nr:metallophosphoesterase [Gaiellaceae bacterium]